MSIQQIVSVTMQAMGAGTFNATMRGMGGAASVAANQISQVTSLISPMKAAIAGLVGGITLASIGSLGAQFENSQNKIAGFLTALGEAPDFQSGLKMTEQVMRRIEISAAALPGEAEDYIGVFTAGLPYVQKAIGGTTDDMVKFTNRIAAVGSTLGIDSAQIGRDLSYMLREGKGGVGMDTRTFTQMIPFLKQVEGQANLTAVSFNKMTEVDRAKLLMKAMDGLQPMIDNAAKSWDAVTGTIATTAKTLFRLSTEPLFDGMKQGMSAVSSMFYDVNGEATALTENVVAASNVILGSFVSGIQSAIGYAIQLADTIGGAMDGSVFGTIVGVLDQIASTYIDYIGAFAEAVYNLVEPLSNLGAGMWVIYEEIIASVMPVLSGFAGAIIELVVGIGEFLRPVIYVVGEALQWMFGLVKDYVVPVIMSFVTSVSEVIKAIGYVLKSLGQDAAAFYGMKPSKKLFETSLSSSVKGAGGGFFDGLMAQIKAEKEKRRQRDEIAAPSGDRKKQQHAAPTARGGAKVVQDFRFGKFTIEQKFAEGYDPDRIAVAFASSVSKVGQRQLQSGFEPLFAVR